MSDSAWRDTPLLPPVLDFRTLAGMVRDCPFHRWLGVELVALDATGIAIAMPWREEFVANPSAGIAHGGILASLIDLAADYAVAARLGRTVPTVDLRIDYHRPAKPGPLTARAAVIKLGGTLGTAESRLFDAAENLIASGRGVFLTRPPIPARDAP